MDHSKSLNIGSHHLANFQTNPFANNFISQLLCTNFTYCFIYINPFFPSQSGVPVDATDHKGLTPLMMACMFGRSLMAAYLLGRGAQAHLTDMNGDSALHWAAYKGFPSLMQVGCNFARGRY